MFIDSRKCGRRERRLARVIAHYNFSSMLPKLWALPRGWALPRPTYGSALRTWSDGCQPPTPLTKGFCRSAKCRPSLWKLRLEVSPPKNHEQEVSLSLHPPLGDTIPKTPKTIHQIFKTSWQKYHVSTSSRATLAAARRITDAQSNIWLTSTRMMSISAET